MNITQPRLNYIASLSEKYPSDEQPAVWAARATSVIASIIGNPDGVSKEEIIELLEILYVMTPDPILRASVEVSMYINNLNLGDNK